MSKTVESATTAETTEDTPVETAQTAKKTAQPVFADDELAAHPAIFGGNVTQECVRAALFVAGVKSATKEEAKTIVEKFMKKEIK